MGIGVSLAFIAIGAILAFALEIDLSGVNIDLVGWILMLVGLASMGFTLKYTRPRRRASLMAGADPGYVEAAEATGPDTFVREERIVERPADPRQEHGERLAERPAPPPPTAGHSRPRPSHDPAYTQDPEFAQDPARQNVTTPSRRRYPFRR
jgi:Domain of unknown function (DUF6458)